MGSIRRAPRTGRWEARFRDSAGRQHTRTFDTRPIRALSSPQPRPMSGEGNGSIHS